MVSVAVCFLLYAASKIADQYPPYYAIIIVVLIALVLIELGLFPAPLFGFSSKRLRKGKEEEKDKEAKTEGASQ